MGLQSLSGLTGRLAAVLLLSLCSAAQAQVHIARPQHRAWRSGPSLGGDGSNMTYHGGPVMAGEKHFYYIWYGDWSQDRGTVDILTDLASALGDSPYFAMNTVYTDKDGASISAQAKYAGAFEDHYSQGGLGGAGEYGMWINPAEEGTMRRVVANAIKNGGLPADPDGIYLIVPSKKVSYPWGFGMQFCAYHSHAAMDGVDLKFAYIGNVYNAQAACGFRWVSPNGDPVADAMASLIAHEINEAVTDPDGNAWYLGDGSHENADLCAWKFGDTQKDSNGAEYNVTLGSRDFLLQQNWVNDAGAGQCRMKLPEAEPVQLAENGMGRLE